MDYRHTVPFLVSCASKLRINLYSTSHFCWHFTSLRSISVDYSVFKRQISGGLRGLKVIDLATKERYALILLIYLVRILC